MSCIFLFLFFVFWIDSCVRVLGRPVPLVFGLFAVEGAAVTLPFCDLICFGMNAHSGCFPVVLYALHEAGLSAISRQ